MKIQKKYICLTLALAVTLVATCLPIPLVTSAGSTPTVPAGFSVSVFATGFDAPKFIEFGPGGQFGTDLYVSEMWVGRIDKVYSNGSVTWGWASGLSGLSGLAFSPDPSGPFGNYLYIGAFNMPTHEIFRVGPAGGTVSGGQVSGFYVGPTTNAGAGSLEFGPGASSNTLFVAEPAAGQISGVNSSAQSTGASGGLGDVRYFTFDRYGSYGGQLYSSDYQAGNIYRSGMPFAQLNTMGIEGPQFSPGGAFGTLFYHGNLDTGDIYSILPTGSWSVWGSGFGHAADIAFACAPPWGPAMYVAAPGTPGVIYKIVPNPNWSIDPQVDLGGRHSSIALDSMGNPHVSYMDANGQLKYAWKTGPGSLWTIEPVDTTVGFASEFPSLAFDLNGVPHISYGRLVPTVGAECLRYASRTAPPPAPGTWTSAVLDSSSYEIGRYSSLAFDRLTGNPHIVYQDWTNRALKHIWYDPLASPPGWQTPETVDSSWAVGFQNSLAIDYVGTLHVSYYHAWPLPYNSGELKYAQKPSSGTWIPPVVVDSTSIDVGRDTSIALDKNGLPHISYLDLTNGDLKHAWLDANNQWHNNDIVDGTGTNVGSFTSIAIGSKCGLIHISYLDSTNGRLKHAWGKPLSWQTETVDTTTTTDFRTSIALDSDDNQHISYYDNTNNRLKYAFVPSSTASVVTATNTGIATFTTSAGKITNLTAVPVPPSPPATFLDGLFSFTITGLNPGPPAQTVAIAITLPNSVPPTSSYYKYRPGASGGPWFPITITSPLPSNTISINLTDGASPDDSIFPTLDGQIIDPGGVGVPVLLAPYLKASTLVNPLMPPGTSFAIDILVNNVAYLTNAVINLNYNASMLTATTAGYRLVSPVIFETDSVTIDNVNGNVYMTGHRRTTSVPPYLTTSFNLPLAFIAFTINDIGTTTLDLHDTQLINKNGIQIIHGDIDGFFDNRLQGTMSVPHVVDTTLSPGAYFDVYVSVGPWMSKPVEKLWGFQFIMNFDPNITVPVDFETLGIFMPGPSEIGADYVAVTGNSYSGDPNGLTTSAPVEVARIGFVVNNIGVTPLTLHDTAMVDVYGAPMIHETTSGSFTNTMNISVSLNTIFVEKRKWSKTTDGELYPLSAQVTNTGDGITKTRAVFDVYGGGVKVAHLVTDEVDIWPGTIIRLKVELNLSPLPEGSYEVVGTVEYINYIGTWVIGQRGSPTSTKTSIVKTFTLYP